MRGNETPGRIVKNFCTSVGVHDVIASANFYDYHLRGLGVVWGKILSFSIDFRCRPHNSRTTVRVGTLKMREWKMRHGHAVKVAGLENAGGNIWRASV